MAEDYACDKFAAQKWRADVCRNCYQPERLHGKKQLKPEGPGVAVVTGTAKPQVKVLEKLRKKQASLEKENSGATPASGGVNSKLEAVPAGQQEQREDVSSKTPGGQSQHVIPLKKQPQQHKPAPPPQTGRQNTLHSGGSPRSKALIPEKPLPPLSGKSTKPRPSPSTTPTSRTPPKTSSAHAPQLDSVLTPSPPAQQEETDGSPQNVSGAQQEGEKSPDGPAQPMEQISADGLAQPVEQGSADGPAQPVQQDGPAQIMEQAPADPGQTQPVEQSQIMEQGPADGPAQPVEQDGPTQIMEQGPTDGPAQPVEQDLADLDVSNAEGIVAEERKDAQPPQTNATDEDEEEVKSKQPEEKTSGSSSGLTPAAPPDPMALNGEIPPPRPLSGEMSPIPPFSEDVLPPPPISFAGEVSPPPQFVGDEEVPPPPHFAGDAVPPSGDIPPPPLIPAGGIPVAPPPPPPPPPVAPPPPVGLPRAAAAPRRPAPQRPAESPGSVARAQAMEAIRGGVSLRKVSPPARRKVGEEKVVDVASELRQKLMKRKKKEDSVVNDVVEEKRAETNKMAELLLTCSGTHSFTRQLKALLIRVDKFLESVGLSQELLGQKLQWPTQLVNDLREVVEHMRLLEERVKTAENLCQQTLLNSQTAESASDDTVPQALPVVHINPEAVSKCANDVVMLARALITDESRYFLAAQSFPVDESDLQSFLQRAAEAVGPLLNLLYQKAFSTYDSIFEPSIRNFDKRFRVQNAQRLLKMCCSLSDALGLHLNLPKHPDYSQAQLKQHELQDDFSAGLKISSREGEWDVVETVQLGTGLGTAKPLGHTQKDVDLVQQIIACLSASEGGALEQLEEGLTPEGFAKIEAELLKATLARQEFKLKDAAIALTRRVYAADAVAAHRYDYDWLLEAVVKGNHERIGHLVKSCGLNVNCQDREVGNSLLHRAVARKDLSTASYLIRLGANPKLKNSRGQSPVQVLALKGFPPSQFPANVEEKEPVFNLAAYINSPSLSDVVLISEEGKRFFAHRLVLCVQSPVFKTMLDSDLWAESRNKEMPLPTVNGRVLQYLLEYLYTGSCHFPRDDLNLALDLMGVADQFLLDPMKLQCEKLLSEKIDAEVVIPLYYAAMRYNTPRLLANSTHFLLAHYLELEDTDYTVLLHLLENCKPHPNPSAS